MKGDAVAVNTPMDPAAGAAELHAMLDAVLRPRVANTQDRQDLVQEAITRTLEVSPRLAPEVVPAYAVTVARNLASAHYRKQANQSRLAHRLYDPPVVVASEQTLLEAESAAAVRAAIIELPDRERDVLLGHIIDGQDTSLLATTTGGTPGAVAARLARARARARVNYVLALRQEELPTGDCRPVLLAISAADARRQNALEAADHLLGCSTCSSLVRPLAERRSALASLIPIPLLLLFLKLRAHAASASATTLAAAAVVATLMWPSVPRSALVTPATVTAAGTGRPVVAPLSGAAAPALSRPPTPTTAQTIPAASVAPAALAQVVPTASAPAVSAAPAPTMRPPLARKSVTVSGPAVEISAPYGFWMLTSSGKIYVVFEGLPSHPVRRGDTLRIKGTLMPVTAKLLNTRGDVLPAERARVKNARTYVNAYARDMSFIR